MLQLSTFLSLALAAVTVHAVPVRHHHKPIPIGECPGMPPATPAAPAAAAPKAIYFMSNAACGNSIVALKVAADGKVSDGSITATGGMGSAEVDAKTGLTTVPDALSSQGSLRVAGNMVFAVNAGSNTVSMFSVSATDPTALTMVGAPADTNGEFPVTMAVSPKNSVVCVGNTGAVAGISCGKFSATTGIGAMDAIRPFQLNQKTPPTGPFNTVADTFFNTAETMLFTTVKGDPTANNTGFLSAFPVAAGAVSTAETRSSPNGTAVLFGTNQIPGSTDLLATDASFGAAILSTDAKGAATLKIKSPVADQKATCWVTISPATGSAFVTDVAANHLLEMDTATGALVETKLNTTNPGMIDLEAAGKWVYALSPGNANVTSAVAVFDVSKKGAARQIQNFNPKGVTDTAQGMAVMA